MSEEKKRKSARARDITDTTDLAKAAREFVASNPVANVPEKVILHMAAEIESLRRDVAFHKRRANALRRRLHKAETQR